jgi:predicted lipoprotein with Yx(FWY)xxD motif
VSSKHAKLGTILAAGPKHLTVYLWEADKGTKSTCEGACAKVWPPVTTSGMPTVAGAALSADLGTTKRADGTEQVTYKGHPLYFYDDDKDSGDAYGQGSKSFGASWYVMKPSGSKIDDDEDSSGAKGDNGDKS